MWDLKRIFNVFFKRRILRKVKNSAMELLLEKYGIINLEFLAQN